MRSLTPAGAGYIRTFGPQASASRKQAWREHLAASAETTVPELDQATYALKISEKFCSGAPPNACTQRLVALQMQTSRAALLACSQHMTAQPTERDIFYMSQTSDHCPAHNVWTSPPIRTDDKAYLHPSKHVCSRSTAPLPAEPAAQPCAPQHPSPWPPLPAPPAGKAPCHPPASTGSDSTL